MPQEKPRPTGTARKRSPYEGMFAQSMALTERIRYQMSADAELPPVRRPDPPSTDSFNRPREVGIRAEGMRGDRRKPYMSPSWSKADSMSAYQNMYHTSREATELVYDESQRADLDLPIGFGLVEQESRFMQDARSEAGAVGLVVIRAAPGALHEHGLIGRVR